MTLTARIIYRYREWNIIGARIAMEQGNINAADPGGADTVTMQERNLQYKHLLRLNEKENS